METYICLHSLPWNHFCVAADVGWYRHCSSNQRPPSAFACWPPWRPHWFCATTKYTYTKIQKYKKCSCAPQPQQTPSSHSSSSFLSSLLPPPLWFLYIQGGLYQTQPPYITSDTLIGLNVYYVQQDFSMHCWQCRPSGIVLLINFVFPLPYANVTA